MNDETAQSKNLAELSRFNGILRQTIESLATDPDPFTFIGRVLVIAGEQLNAPVVEYWHHEASDFVKLQLTCRDGKILHGSDVPGDPRVSGLRLNSVFPESQPDVFLRETHSFTFDLANDKQQNDYFRPLGFDLPGWCRERGVHSLLNLALRPGSKATGAMIVYVRAPEEFTDSKVALAQALAHQIALAMRLTELADRSKNVAVLHEKEIAARQQSVELEKANETLRRGAEHLVREEPLESLLTDFLGQCIGTLHGSSGIVMLCDKQCGGKLRVAAVHELGRAFTPAEIKANPFLSEVKQPPAEGLWSVFDALLRGETPVVRVASLEATDPEGFNYHSARGHALIWHSPMLLHGRLLGFVALALREAQMPLLAHRETVKALTQQLVVALEIKRLEDESHKAAMSREKARAAQERAAELSEINSQLQQNLFRLVGGKDFRETLGQLLASASKQLRAEAGYLFTYQESEQTLQLASCFKEGQGIHKAESAWEDPFPAGALPVWRLFAESRDAILWDPRIEAPLLDQAAGLVYHLRSRLVFGTALAIGDRLLGCMLFSFAEPLVEKEIPVQQYQLLRSLGSLASMSLETDRLARRAKDAAVAEERNRLAQELHDALAGSFTGIFMQLQAAGDLIDSDQEELSRGCLLRAEQLARSGLRDVREFAYELRIDLSRAPLLSESLRELTATRTTGTRLRGRVLVIGAETPLKPPVAHALLRIAQEALGNTQRYAEAETVLISLDFQADRVILTLTDDGLGFTVSSDRSSEFGLAGMRTRAIRLGGKVDVQSAPGAGTSVRAELPNPYLEKTRW